MKNIIQSHKHIRQDTVASVTVGAIANIDVAVATQNPTRSTSTHVDVGSIIKAIFVEYWIQSTDASTSSSIITVEKIVSSSPAMTYANSVALHNYPNKNNVFHTSMGLIADNNANPQPLIRQWIKIPKGKQRMSVGDKLRVNISGISAGVNYCGQCTYKEYT